MRALLALSLAAGAAACLGGVARAAGADTLDLRVGDRLRITDRQGRYVYVLRANGIDSLLLESPSAGGVRSVRIDETAAIEVGRSSSRPAAVMAGACIGVAALAAGCTALMNDDRLRDEGVMYIAAGGAVGGLVGALWPGTRWRTVYGGGSARPPGLYARAPLVFDSTGADLALPEEGVRLHFNIGFLGGYDKENAPRYERSQLRFITELGLKYVNPARSRERLEFVALGYSVSFGDAGYENRHSVGPTVALRLNDRWTANVMAGPLWFRSTEDFETGFQCRGSFVYRKILSCEALLCAAPPSDAYEASGGDWQTSLYTGFGLHGSPRGGFFPGEVAAAVAIGAAAMAVILVLGAAVWNID